MSGLPQEQTNAFFRKYKTIPGNQFCFECGRGTPVWASVPFGILLCMDCAGKHRGLGTHLSFVRSLEMDIWTLTQIAMMKVGGNAACAAFFKAYGVSDLPLNSKFSSDVAGAYRAKIIALIENKPWTDPKPEELNQYRISTSVLSSSGPTFSRNDYNPGSPIRTATKDPLKSSPVNHNTGYNPRYGPSVTSISSNDSNGGYIGGSYNGGSYQDSYRSKSKGFDLDKITNAIQKEGEKGLSLAVKVFNQARLISTGNGYDNLDKGHSFANSGGAQYTSGDRFYSINEYQPRSYPPQNSPQRPVIPKTTPQKQTPQKTSSPITPATPPTVSTVDEGGWDLSGWKDDQWDDTLQFTTTDNSSTSQTSRPPVDIWDFGTRAAPAPTQTIQNNNTETTEQNQINNPSNGKFQTQKEEESPISHHHDEVKQNDVLPLDNFGIEPPTQQEIIPPEIPSTSPQEQVV